MSSRVTVLQKKKITNNPPKNLVILQGATVSFKKMFKRFRQDNKHPSTTATNSLYFNFRTLLPFLLQFFHTFCV
jgi:hypothetical protein